VGNTWKTLGIWPGLESNRSVMKIIASVSSCLLYIFQCFVFMHCAQNPCWTIVFSQMISTQHTSFTIRSLQHQLIVCFRLNILKLRICQKMNICLKKKSPTNKSWILCHKHQQLERRCSSRLKQRKKKVKMMILQVTEVTYLLIKCCKILKFLCLRSNFCIVIYKID